ncbi:MAG TPA: hypothetical protein VNT54_17770 [Solirubrobacteraceae bacterium]|nr:hypothetical protein [Solirubrobacteraceae bacterium]
MRLSLVASIIAVVALAGAAAPAAADDVFRRCAGIPRNGVLELRSKNLPCPSARALAQRTLDVKCFLNERSCRHTFRARRWTCTVSSTFESVRCTTAGRRVSWRNPG